MFPCRAVYEWGYIFVFLRWKCGISQDPNIPKKYKNPNTWRKKTNIPNNTKTHISGEKKQISQTIQKPKYLAKKREEKNPFVKGLAGAHRTRVQISGSLSKTAWTLHSEGIWGFILEPACMCILKLLPGSTVRCTM